MSKVYALMAAGVTVAALAGMASYAFLADRGAGDPLAQCREGNVGGADIGGPFTLLDKDGKTVTDKEVLTAPTLVYFGYTFCPDVCPMDMSRNADVADLLEQQGKSVNLVFITVDPARDTPQVAGEFAQNISEKAVGLSGSPEQIAAAAKAYKAYYKAHIEDDPEFYLVDHSAFTYLMLPDHGFADFYKHEAKAEDMAKGVSCMLDAAARLN